LSLNLLPDDIIQSYEVFEWNHSASILHSDFPKEYEQIIAVLRGFKLYKQDILAKGGRKSPIATRLDSHFYQLGWEEKWFDIKINIDNQKVEIPTHGIDCYKNRVGVEVEWNNKDPFFDRDLNNFRLLFDLNALSVGVIITRCTELQDIFNVLGKGNSYGPSTTHMHKLLPKILGNGAGGCPVLAFGISPELYVE
jgi:hypothetical protein